MNHPIFLKYKIFTFFLFFSQKNPKMWFLIKLFKIIWKEWIEIRTELNSKFYRVPNIVIHIKLKIIIIKPKPNPNSWIIERFIYFLNQKIKNHSRTEIKNQKNRKWTFMSKHIGEQTNGLINSQQKIVPRFESAGQNLVIKLKWK